MPPAGGVGLTSVDEEVDWKVTNSTSTLLAVPTVLPSSPVLLKSSRIREAALSASGSGILSQWGLIRRQFR